MNDDYGARIERGEIVYSEHWNGHRYQIRSLDRPEVETGLISSEKEYNVGRRVFFFVFGDGTGGILSEMDT